MGRTLFFVLKNDPQKDLFAEIITGLGDDIGELNGAIFKRNLWISERVPAIVVSEETARSSGWLKDTSECVLIPENSSLETVSVLITTAKGDSRVVSP